MKILLILGKTLEKQKLNFSRSALFQMKTRVSLKYFVNDCRFNKDREAFKKLRNLRVSLLRLNKNDYFETLDIKSVTDTKIFWKTVAPPFCNKSKASSNITLSKNEKLIVNDQKRAEVFNNYFNSIVKELNTPIDQTLLNDASIFDYSIIAGAYNHKRHPVVQKLRKMSKNMTFFLFIMLTPIKSLKFSKNIHSKRATQQGDILFQRFYLKCCYFTLTITLFLIDLGRLMLSVFIREMILLIKQI